MRRWVAVVFLAILALGTLNAGAQSPGPDGEFPPEMCFHHIPEIDHCIDQRVGWFYLAEPQLLATQDVYIEMSQNQAIWMWGYPLTELRWERNADGDCVATQWFERAVFEFHFVGAHGVLADWRLRRLGAELRGDALYEPELCTGFPELSDTD